MIARDLAAWGIGLKEVPEAVRAAALRHLLDGLANAVSALRVGAADAAVQVARELGGPAEASILGTNIFVSASAAALANGTLVHALDFDDTHAGGLVHATSVTLPAAFAVGQQVGASGEEVLLAAVVGYETVCRVAAAAPHGFHARGLHATMIAGVFSSAIVAARLMRLDLEQTTNALGIAGSQAGGLLAFLGTGASTKQLHPGFASQAGIIAARLAQAGATGPDTVFDGPHGIFDVFVDQEVDRSSITADLGQRWETTRIGIKPYPACQLSHATLDAMKNAMAEHPFQVDEIVSIVAEVHPDSASVVCDETRDLTRPSSAYAAKFSLPWSLAAITVDGELTSSTFDAENIAREELAELASRVKIKIGSFDCVASDAPGEVNITLVGGRTVVGKVLRSGGGPESPPSNDILLAKFAGVSRTAAERVLTQLQEIDAADTIEMVMEAVNDAAQDPIEVKRTQ